MSIDEQLKQIKLHSGKSLYDVQLRKTRITAFVLSASALVTIIFLLFAFVQKAAADTAREEAIKSETRARQFEVELRKCQMEKTALN